jgi:hypothetical protein
LGASPPRGDRALRLYLLPGILRAFAQNTAYFRGFPPVFKISRNRAKGYRFNPLRVLAAGHPDNKPETIPNYSISRNFSFVNI